MSDQPPLEGDWVEVPLALELHDDAIAVRARANWGDVEVLLTVQGGNLTRGEAHRGWSFGMATRDHPEMRFVAGGVPTERGVAAAVGLARELLEDWRAACANRARVLERCARHPRESAAIEADLDIRQAIVRERRIALREAFSNGCVSQRDYQAGLAAIREELSTTAEPAQSAIKALEAGLVAWGESSLGRKVPAKDLLAMAQILAAAD